jgi:hypothetical protein
MTLIERIRDLTDRSDNLADLDQKLAETKRLHSLQSDASSFARLLGEQVKFSRLLGDQGIECDVPSSVENALSTLSKLKERYDREMRAGQLTQGKDWPRFKEQVEKVCAEAAKVNKIEWAKFVEFAYSGQKPNEVEASLALTPENKRNLPLYRKAFSELTQYARSLPRERADFDGVRNTARQLTETYQQFDFDVPESVKRFLKAIGEDGADLALLTDEVISWLEENNSTKRYRIVGRGGFQ